MLLLVYTPFKAVLFLCNTPCGLWGRQLGCTGMRLTPCVGERMMQRKLTAWRAWGPASVLVARSASVAGMLFTGGKQHEWKTALGNLVCLFVF